MGSGVVGDDNDLGVADEGFAPVPEAFDPCGEIPSGEGFDPCIGIPSGEGLCLGIFL